MEKEITFFKLQYISTAIYMSPWFETDPTQKKLVLFVMMRAQRQQYLSLGGFMDMNVDAFGSVSTTYLYLSQKKNL